MMTFLYLSNMDLLREDISRIKSLMKLNEGVSVFPTEDKKHLENFVDFVVKELGITEPVDINYQTDKDGINTTAVYKYSAETSNVTESEIKVYSKERALQDIMRSVAHELVHHKQNEDGELEGEVQNVGGPIEDEANAKAGELLKKYGLDHPEIYGEEQFSADEEMAEQEEGDGDTGGDSDTTNANVSTWETGLTRGPANQLTITVWNSNLGRGKSNMIDQNSKWETGITRDKANKLN
jgi:hypothetical protein